MAVLLSLGCVGAPRLSVPPALVQVGRPACLTLDFAPSAHGLGAGTIRLRLEAATEQRGDGCMGRLRFLAVDTAFEAYHARMVAAAEARASPDSQIAWACRVDNCRDTSVIRARRRIPHPEADRHYAPTWSGWRELPERGELLFRWGAETHEEFLTVAPRAGRLEGETILLGWPWRQNHEGPDWGVVTGRVESCGAAPHS